MKERVNRIIIIISLLVFSFVMNPIKLLADTYTDDFNYNNIENTNDTNAIVQYEEDGSDTLVIILIVVASIVALEVIFIIIYFINARLKKAKNKRLSLEERLENKRVQAKHKIENELPDFDYDEFNDLVFKIYTDIKDARSSFNYDELRSLLTDDLYNAYYSDLSSLEKQKKKINTSDYLLNNVFVTNFIKTEKDYIIDVYLNATLYEYVTNNMGNVVKGTKDNSVIKKYIIRLTRRIDDNKDICPNCGSQLLNDVSNICPFCNNIIINKKYDWVVMKMDELK